MNKKINNDRNNIEEGTTNKNESAWNKPYIPDEFYYITGTVDTGYVISDNKKDIGMSVGGTGNQFVWIPVDGEKVKFERKDYNDYLPISMYREDAQETIYNANVL